MRALTQEQPEHAWEVEALFDSCFAPGREALSSYRLREGVPPIAELCLIWRDAGALVAASRAWPVRIGPQSAVLIGPVAVHPTQQGAGLGTVLIQETLERAQALGWKRAILVGDFAYYSRFGFEKIKGVEMPPPTNPERVLGFELEAGAWEGVSGRVERACD